ncbi:MAG: alpha/beta hydrolase [Anaerolineales bacterium]|nr:alpha/beta hydrolase [Anaerolineales bacterium]
MSPRTTAEKAPTLFQNTLKIRLLLLLLTPIFLAACGAGEAAESTRPTLEPCTLNGDVDANCGTISVPENRDEPNGRMIDIYFAVIPAQNTAVSDPIFMLAGGPGQAATEVYPFVINRFSSLNQTRDIVLVDQRGTGQSNPLACPAIQELPLDADGEMVRQTLDECRQTLMETADLTQYVTEIAMQDLDAVRSALGYEQINLMGVSYGTRAAQTYMRLFPQHTRTVVMDAVVSPSLVLQLQSPADGQRALELLFARCAADEACAERFPAFADEFDQLVAGLQTEKEVALTHPVTGERLDLTLTDDELMQVMFNLLYSPDLTSLLPLLVEGAVDTADYTPLIAQALALTGGQQMYQGMFYAVTCSEDAPRIDAEEAAAIQAETQFPLVSADFTAVCEDWPTTAVSEQMFAPLTSDIPTLLLSGEADPITPPYYADEVAETLTDKQHIVLDGYGHGILSVGCVPTIVTDFVEAGTAVDLDTTCTAEITPPPFFISPVGPRP